MILKNVFQRGIEILKGVGHKTPAVEAGVILSYTIKRDRIFIYTHDDFELSDADRALFFERIIKRSKGMPLQYIIGYQEFMSLNFIVSPSVLIPRQDTEVVVEAVLKHSGNIKRGMIEILDIGTGSGCISVSLAYYINECHITAVDISAHAVEIAQLNATNMGVKEKITFVETDLFERLEPYFDIIVSNPPYIKTKQIGELQTEVRNYEPQIALDGGQDGLDYYRNIISRAPCFLKSKGLLAFEVGFDQAVVVSKMMGEFFSDIEIIKDLAGIDRVVTGIL